MNLRDIAARARVSTATVSRALNRVPTVDPRLARRVWQVVDQFHYYPNTQARALVLGSTRIFGLIVSEITDPFFAELVQAFEEIAVQNHYEVLLSSIGPGPRHTELTARRMIERRVDGVALLTFGMEEPLVEALRLSNAPIVIADAGQRFAKASNIRVDYQHGIRQAVQHLAALRHVRIAFVMGPSDRRSAIAQRDAFEQSMHEIGLEAAPDFVVTGNLTAEGGRTALLKLMTLPERPTSVLCSNDMTAVGLLAEACGCGLTVPQKLSVVGIDDIRLSQFTIPPLTTVRISTVDLATLAFQALIHDTRDRGKTWPDHEYVLTPNLVVRQSTGLAVLTLP